MATATIEITLPGLTGFSLSLQLYTYQTDTLVHTIALTEATNRKGTYSGTQVSPTPGLYHARCVEGTTVRGEGYVDLTDAAIVHTVMDSPAAVRLGTPAGASIAADIAAIAADLPSKITKNVALANFPFIMILASDDITPATGLTVTATRSIDGAAFAACANAVTEIANGWYKISLAASDLNGDTIALRFTAATANDRNITIVTQAT